MIATKEHGQYSQSLIITEREDAEYVVSFSASRVNSVNTCRFYGRGRIVDDTVEVEIANWKTPTVMTITSTEDGVIDVFTKDFNNRFALNYFCGGGGSLAGLYQKQDSLPSAAQFLITNNYVGWVNYQVTMSDLLDSGPKSPVRKETLPGELVGGYQDRYVMYDENDEAALIIRPLNTENTPALVGNIQVLDPRFRTIKGIGTDSRFGELRDQHEIREILTDKEYLLITVDGLNALFRVSKDELLPGWWNEVENVVDLSRIPSDAPLTDILVRLNWEESGPL